VRGTFRTESTSYDYLTIQGMKYGGTTPPGSLSLTTGETFARMFRHARAAFVGAVLVKAADDIPTLN
jgi:hypothetical protein